MKTAKTNLFTLQLCFSPCRECTIITQNCIWKQGARQRSWEKKRFFQGIRPYHLYDGQTFFPFDNSGLNGFAPVKSQQVVWIHHHVNQAVEHDRERSHSARFVFATQPSYEEGGNVMIEVQRRNLILLFSKHKKYLRKEKRSDFWRALERSPERIGTDRFGELG